MKKISEEIDADLLLIDFCAESRLLQCKSADVRRQLRALHGIILDEKPGAFLLPFLRRADGRSVM